jgi:hypothetical protein
MAEFKTERLTAHTIGGDDRGWQEPVTDGRNPVDVALEWLSGDEVIGADMMFPVALAWVSGLTVNEAQALITAALAEDSQNGVDRLRAHWPPGGA